MDMIEFCRVEVFKTVSPLCEPTIVWLNGHKMTENEFEHFLGWDDSYQVWGSGDVKKLLRSPPYSPIRKATQYFIRNSNKLFDRYLADRHSGDIKTAMRAFGNFKDMFADFMTYYHERRKSFMDKLDTMLSQVREAKLSQRKSPLPQSHGGVANLLKVLTKTMTQQGAKITSIAKMQYQICMQAGIYVPDEFFTDVLVAQDMIDGEAEHGDSKKSHRSDNNVCVLCDSVDGGDCSGSRRSPLRMELAFVLGADRP